MDIEQRLRQLNRIEPNAIYARASRARILTARPRLTLRGFFADVLQSGSAIALTGVLLLIVAGGFSVWQLIGPLTGLDPRIYAEAEAIDMQLQLANLHYEDGVSFGRQNLIAAKSALRAISPSPSPVGTGEGSGGEGGEGNEPQPSATPAVGDPGSTPGPIAATEPGSNATSTTAAVTAAASVSTSTEPVGVEEALDILSQ